MTTTLETPCREAPGTRRYGRKYDPATKTQVPLHRWVMAQIHGWEALDGKVVRHRCDNPPCFRFDHLELGTIGDNVRDAVERGQHNNQYAGRTHCPQGHSYEEHGYVRPDGRGRHCRLCSNEHTRALRARRRLEVL